MSSRLNVLKQQQQRMHAHLVARHHRAAELRRVEAQFTDARAQLQKRCAAAAVEVDKSLEGLRNTVAELVDIYTAEGDKGVHVFCC